MSKRNLKEKDRCHEEKGIKSRKNNTNLNNFFKKAEKRKRKKVKQT